jgi:hypothetical protein
MVHKQSARGAGVNPNNDLARELTRARWSVMARRKTKKPAEPLLQAATYEPQQELIKKPLSASKTQKKPPHP